MLRMETYGNINLIGFIENITSIKLNDHNLSGEKIVMIRFRFGNQNQNARSTSFLAVSKSNIILSHNIFVMALSSIVNRKDQIKYCFLFVVNILVLSVKILLWMSQLCVYILTWLFLYYCQAAKIRYTNKMLYEFLFYCLLCVTSWSQKRLRCLYH